jgi:hypothetical protein
MPNNDLVVKNLSISLNPLYAVMYIQRWASNIHPSPTFSSVLDSATDPKRAFSSLNVSHGGPTLNSSVHGGSASVEQSYKVLSLS